MCSFGSGSPDSCNRHVVAAAIHVEAKLIITKNLRDFPAAALEPWGISAQHPDAFLAEIHREQPHVLAEIVREIARAWSAGESTPGHVVDRLAVDAPGVVGLIQASLRGGSGSG